MLRKYILYAALSIFVLPAYSETKESVQASDQEFVKLENKEIPARWYTRGQVIKGNKIYQAHCVRCHMENAAGAKNWKRKAENGRYPAPALNGQAHTYHHKLDNLRKVVREGGMLRGGTMPAFSAVLTHQQVDDVLAWVQSNWSDDIYMAWLKWSKLDRQ